MTPNELKELVQSSASNNTLRLNASALGDSAFSAIVAAVFPSGIVIRLSNKPAFIGAIARIRGRLSILGFPDAEYDITLNALTPAIQLGFRGTVPPGSLRSVVEKLTTGRFSTPPIVDFTTEAAQVSLAVSGAEAVLTVDSKGGIFDRIAVEARIAKGGIDYLVLLHVRESDARFSRLIPALAPLDAFVPRDVNVLLASADVALARFSELQLPAGIDRLDPGAVLFGALPLGGDLLALVRQLLGINAVPLRLSLGPVVPPSLEVRSRELPDMDVVPNLLTISRAAFVARPLDPIEVAVEGLVRIQPLEGFPQLRGRFAVAPGRVTIEVGTADPWRAPFGIERLEVVNVTVQGEILPVTSIVIAGSIALSTRDATKQMSVVVRFTDGVPSMLAGSFNEPITILDIIETFFGSTGIPDVFSIVQIRDVAFSVVPPPLPVTIGGETFEVGVFFKGTVAVAGLFGRCAIRVDPVNGLNAQAELGRIDLLGLIVVSGPSAQGGPVLVLRERQSPFLQLTGAVSIFGLSRSIEAEVRADGFDVTVTQNIGPIHANLSCSVSNDRAAVNGSVNAMFSADIGPITLPGTDISMGTIHIAETGFEGQLHAAVSNGVDATVNGTFAVLGVTFTVNFRVDGELRTLEDLPGLLVAELQRNAAQIFAAILSNVDAWVRWLEQRLVELAEGVARVLIQVFHQTIDAATEVMNRIGRPPEQILRELTNVGVSPLGAAQALVKIGILPVDIARGLVKDVLGVDLPHIDLNIPDIHIDVPIHIEIPPPHIEIPPIHIDVPLPHVDIPPPHVDIPTPHVDIPTPHVDIPTPHFDL